MKREYLVKSECGKIAVGQKWKGIENGVTFEVVRLSKNNVRLTYIYFYEVIMILQNDLERIVKRLEMFNDLNKEDISILIKAIQELKDNANLAWYQLERLGEYDSE